MIESDAIGETVEAGCTGRMRGDERREQLIRVAIALFARKGFNGTTTKEIAAAAGVTEALIFRHFPNKDALYEAILRFKVEEAAAAEWLDTMRSFTERRDDRGLIRFVVSSVLHFHRKNPEFQRLMLYSGLEGHNLALGLREQLIRPIHDFLEAYVRTRQEEGAFADIEPSMAVFAIVAVPLHHAMVTNLSTCPIVQLTDEQVIEHFTVMAFDGLRRRGEMA